jgi:hypothetical protein
MHRDINLVLPRMSIAYGVRDRAQGARRIFLSRLDCLEISPFSRGQAIRDMTAEKPTFYEQVLGVNIRLPFLVFVR